MAILSWIKSTQHFTRRSAVDEFKDFAGEEKDRRQNSGSEFVEGDYDQAVELVLRKLLPYQQGENP